MKENPVIIIGMHRSGTSLLAQILHKCGVFMGARKDNHNEALFFKAKNQYLYRLAHAEWDNPEPVKYLLSNHTLRQDITVLMKNEFVSLKSLMDYWGLARPWRFKSPRKLEQLWGWKDPRNSYTLPIWLDVFPKAKVIHIYRNGIDVANSLKRREEKRMNQLHNCLLSCRCLILKEAFAVWTEYVNTCLDVINQLPAEQALQLQYEKFLKDPKPHLQKIAKFLKTEWTAAMIAEVTGEIRSDRAHAFLQDPELQHLYEQQRNHPLMVKLGYDRLTSSLVYNEHANDHLPFHH